MSKKKILFAIPDKCTGCNQCTYVCSGLHEGAFAPEKARIRINNFPFEGYSVPSICLQCPKALCLEACTEKALYRNSLGAVAVKEDICSGCSDCVTACPYGMIELDGAGIARKCDLCGGEPACVDECYAGAIVYQVSEPALAKLKGAQLLQRSATGTPGEKRYGLGVALMNDARTPIKKGEI